MNILKHEFGNFIKNILVSGIELSSYEKRIISIVYNNFDTILKTNNRSRGEKNRGFFIKGEILGNIDDKDFTLPNISSVKYENYSSENNLILLKELKISYFRGFVEEEIFAFHKKFNLIYGYNGTGKSSFSESLEYKLTGNIRESIHRGYKNDIDKYISNIHSNGKTLISLIDYNGKTLEEDIDKYRYSFIEKSRIDDFVKFKNEGANDSIQNLFGFGEFNNFIFEFTNEIRLVDLKEEEISLLNSKKHFINELKNLKKNIDDGLLKLKSIFKKNNLDIEEKEIINDYIIHFSFIVKDKKESILSLNETKLLEKEKINVEIQKILDKNKKIPFIKWGFSLFIFILSLIISYLFINYYFLLINLGMFFIFYFVNDKSVKFLEDKKNNVGGDINYDFLEDLNVKVIEFKRDYKNFIDKEKKLEKFLEENKTKLLSAEENYIRKEELERYEKGYKNFYKILVNYKDIVSEGIIKDELEKYTVDIFNKLSYSRKNKIFIKSIKIPKKDGEKLLIIDSSETEIDTLKIFSEGNLRCLGISILLSKSIINNQDFIIFDDIVNSLDFEFRKSIIDLLIGYEPFKNKQFIITTHSEKFLNLFLNEITNKDYHEYRLIQSGNKKITSISDRSDLFTIIEKNLEKGNIIDGLAKSRLLLEKVLSKISKKYIKKTVKVSCFPDFKVNTYQKINSIYGHFKTESNQDFIELLDVFINNNIYYKYLNSSSHDDESLEDISYEESIKIYDTLVKLNSL